MGFFNFIASNDLVSLKGFQDSLSKRLAHKETVNFELMRLAATANSKGLLFDMHDITEVTPVSSVLITRVPVDIGHVIGAVNLHGKCMCVIDLSMLLFKTKGNRNKGMILTISPGYGLDVCLLVDKVERMAILNTLNQIGSVMFDEHGGEWEIINIESLFMNDEFLAGRAKQ